MGQQISQLNTVLEWITNHWIDSAAGFNHRSPWQQRCASHRQLKFLCLNPLAQMLPSYIMTYVQKKQFKGLCIDMPLTQALLKN